MRDYQRIVKRLEALDRTTWELLTLAQASGFPIYGVRSVASRRLPSVYLSAGTHGDEPAGVEAVLRFLEAQGERWTECFSFWVLPCLNPWGYVHDRRENADGVDLNWAYDREELPEIRAVHHWVAGRRFALAVDLHEDWESPGFYLYELRRNGPPVGEEIVRRVGTVCPINLEPTIEGDPARLGVIHPDPNAPRRQERGAGIPIALFRDHTDHLVTTETPTVRPLQERVEAHRIALETLLEAHQDDSAEAAPISS
ncbi:MAG: hypothetical protein KatS3mg115_0869 [Candidatus Poribacteria bacterium]|nr:MAG: hypothetical protein KatS3mg115_0869 [Candidatus Poribacteria bacterium]